VIAAVHNACVGGGVDLVATADIRLCTEQAWFQVKEVDLGKTNYIFFCLLVLSFI
jgi:delta(3,5)-delta(2,4)-dienoyl-CoA isomerase